MSEGIKALRAERRRALLEHRAEDVAKLETDVRERLIFLIHLHATSTNRYEYLEERYGIAARKWKNVCNRVQQPGIDMLSSIIKDNPQYATWLLIGKGSYQNQTDPLTHWKFDTSVEGEIDPTQKGWEKKLGEALLRNIASYIKKTEGR